MKRLLAILFLAVTVIVSNFEVYGAETIGTILEDELNEDIEGNEISEQAFDEEENSENANVEEEDMQLEDTEKSEELQMPESDENIVKSEEEQNETAMQSDITTYSTAHTQAEALQWVKSQVGKTLDMDGAYGAQCVDLILAYYDYLGVPRASGNGADYTWNSLPSGWKRIQGAAPQPGDILVYTGGYENYGHVAIYESDYSTYHQNFDGHSYVERITYRYNGLTTPYWGVIRPDFNSKWYSSLTPVNIGNVAYANILKNSGWATIGCLDKNLEIIKPLNDGADIWKFVRQSDGSYIIYNCKYDNMVLDVENTGSAEGTKVHIHQQWGTNNTAQRWYIYGRWSGEFILRPQCSDNVLTVKNGSNAYGTGIELRAYSNSTSQQLAFYTQQSAQATQCSVSKGTSITSTIIKWSKAAYATAYNIRIFRGQPGDLKEYNSVWGEKGTSCSVVLPAGYYEVYVDACNSFSYAKSNVVSFQIEQYVPNGVTNLKAASAGKNKVKLTWNASYGADGYLIYAQKNGKYGYCGMTTKGTSFTDVKALDTEYNFYWIFPYTQDKESGKMFPGPCAKYVYSKGIIPAVQNLKASSVKGGVKLTWDKQLDSEGYLVYGRRAGGKYEYIGMTTKGTTFTDTKASKTQYNYYWVYPYHKNGSKMVVGGTPKYTYGRAR